MDVTRRNTVLLGALMAVVADEAMGGSMTITPAQEKLVAAAREARDKAYAPYSKFQVGAALETEDGTIFRGCNVENISYGATICAERNAVFQAVAAGHTKFKAIAVIADLPRPITPCGMCRQVLGEFGGGTQVICANLKGDTMVKTVGDLLPDAFDFDPNKV
jgi:cytidine deaminase